MKALGRWPLMLALLVAVPLLAQEKGDGKKADDKGKTEKKEEKKEEKKATGSTNKYQLLRQVTCKLSRTDTEEMLLEIELPVSRNNKQTYSIASDVKVRTLKLAERLDDKNKPIPYTPQEKAKLKGDNPKLPGYAAELSSLKSGQLLEIDLSTHKPGSKKKDDDEKPFITMIVIKEEPPKMIEKKKK